MSAASDKREVAIGTALGLLAGGLIALAAVSPWLFGFAEDSSAISSQLPLALALIPIAILASTMRAAALVLAIGGAWLIVSPWLIGYADAGTAAWAVDGLVGASLVGIAAALWLILGPPSEQG